MLCRKRTLVVTGLLVSVLLAGCTGKGGSQASGPTQALDRPAVPVWSVSTQPAGQPELVDGLLVGAVVDDGSPVGQSAVVWDAGSGDELWRHDGRSVAVFDVDGQTRVGYLVYRSEAWSVALVDPRTGEESLAAMPGGRRADYLQKCDTTVCASTYHEDYAPDFFRLDPASMTLVPTGWPSSTDYPAGISMSTDSGALVVSYEGDGDHAAWARPFAEMFGPEADWWGPSYIQVPWTWYGDREMLLGTTSTAVYDTEFDRSQEFQTGAFAPDGTTVWQTNGRACSSGRGGWTTAEILVLCVSTGTATYTTVTRPNEFSIEPTIDDTGNYWVGVDVRTGEQKWRFPKEGTLGSPTGIVRYAPIVDDGSVLARTDEGAYLLDVATGEAEALDPDGAFLCTQEVGQDTDEGGRVLRTLRRICGPDGNPVVAPWPADWVRLTSLTDGKGRYYVATASQLVAFDL